MAKRSSNENTIVAIYFVHIAKGERLKKDNWLFPKPLSLIYNLQSCKVNKHVEREKSGRRREKRNGVLRRANIDATPIVATLYLFIYCCFLHEFHVHNHFWKISTHLHDSLQLISILNIVKIALWMFECDTERPKKTVAVVVVVNHSIDGTAETSRSAKYG